MKIKGIPYAKVKSEAFKNPQVLSEYLQEKTEHIPIEGQTMVIFKMSVVMGPWPNVPYSFINDKKLIIRLYPWLSFVKYVEKSPDFFIPRDDVF